ncbi:MAG TPA: ABC transporter permease, partial [Alphaproteobacteria bacterium]
MTAARFSPARFTAILVKEFVQMRRDRLTFGMMIGIPIMQLLLFGYAINADPRALPTAVISADRGPFERSFVRAMENTSYFRVVRHVATETEAQRLIETGAVQFVVAFPENFARDLQRGTRPAVLIEADATDPAATS